MKACALSVGVLIAATTLSTSAWSRPGVGTCGVCHSDEKVQFEDSAHAGVRMVCVDCHGGDSTDTEITAMSPSKGFRGSPKRSAVPQFCANCHSDRARMRQYGLPTSQFEDYQTSRHGQQWAKGDKNVAVCIDCHGVHHILPPDDPRSSVYPGNVPKTCSKCHSDKKLMDQYGLPSDVFERFSKSLHGQRLLQGDVKAVPSCATCHGSHGALPPGVQEIGNVCGQCHVAERDLVNDSPHGRATLEGKMSECVSCHGHHYIQRPAVGDMDALCVKCHKPGTRAYLTGDRIKTMILESNESLDAAQQAVRALQEEGQDVESLTSMLLEAKTAHELTAQDQHSADPDVVERHSGMAAATGQNVLDDIAQIHKQMADRKIGLTVALLFILWTCALLYWKRRRVEDRQATAHASETGR